MFLDCIDLNVSIHAPVMDANRIKRNEANRKSFNPRARDGREKGLLTLTICEMVSIHAPVMDAKRSRANE